MRFMKQKKDLIRYGAGACFFLLAVLEIIDGLYFEAVVYVIACIFASVSFFAGLPLAGTIGSILFLLGILLDRWVFRWIWHIRYYGEAKYYWCLFRDILDIATYVLFLTMTISKKDKRKLGYAAGTTAAIIFLGNVVILKEFLSLTWIVKLLLWVAVLILAGLAYESIPVKQKAVAGKAMQSTLPDKIQKLERLHTLMENGVITREEFEAKKKQLLGV